MIRRAIAGAVNQAIARINWQKRFKDDSLRFAKFVVSRRLHKPPFYIILQCVFGIVKWAHKLSCIYSYMHEKLMLRKDITILLGGKRRESGSLYVGWDCFLRICRTDALRSRLWKQRRRRFSIGGADSFRDLAKTAVSPEQIHAPSGSDRPRSRRCSRSGSRWNCADRPRCGCRRS